MNELLEKKTQQKDDTLLSKIYLCISSPQTTKDLFSVIVEDNAAIKTLC